MSFIREARNSLIVANQNCLIQYRYDQKSDNCIKLPIKQSSITSITTSLNGELIAVSFENKQIQIYNENLIELVKSWTTNRCPSRITFTINNDLIVADKTGDVYLYKIGNNDDKPVLLLGHPSIILDVILSDCGRYLITGDRDEKIRVSYYPNCYNIVSYCLGHCEFITSLKLYRDTLISSSGDGTIRFWNYQIGKQLHLIDTNQYLSSNEDVNSILKQFQNEMIKEKIEIKTLPIIDMNVVEMDQQLLIAVSLFRYNKIQLYQINFGENSFDTKLWKNIESTTLPFTFYLNKKLNLFILNSTELFQLNLINNSSDTDVCQQLYEKYKSDLSTETNNSTIKFLYKRKFDNVQEYFEKKKIRLESS